MLLTYDFLKANVAKVVFLKDLEMGHVDDYEQGYVAQLKTHIKIDENQEVIVSKGTIAKLNVQSYNMHFELIFDNGEQLDLAFDDDNELNDYVQCLEVVGPNKHFVKEGA